jgi:small subunit ribosomal protein S4e
LARKGGARHLKRLSAPASWPIHRKEYCWAVKPIPGPHSISSCIPLLIVLRDILSYAKTAREAKIILAEGKVKVDGKTKRDEKYPISLMDIVEIPDAKSIFRVLPLPGRGLNLVKVPMEEASFKLCRIEDEKIIKGGNIQLNLHDGRNILIKINDSRNPVQNIYETYDTLQVSIPGQKILKHISFKEGNYALITAGRNIGAFGKITKIDEGTASRPRMVTVDSSTGAIQTVAEYVFAVGEGTPIIRLTGVSE